MGFVEEYDIVMEEVKPVHEEAVDLLRTATTTRSPEFLEDAVRSMEELVGTMEGYVEKVRAALSSAEGRLEEVRAEATEIREALEEEAPEET